MHSQFLCNQTYRVGQLKRGQLTLLLVLECVDKIQWFFGKSGNSLARHTLWEA